MKTLAQLASEKVQENLVKLKTNQIRFPGSVMDPAEKNYTKKYSERCLKEISKHTAKVIVTAIVQDIQLRGRAYFGFKALKNVLYVEIKRLLDNFQEDHLLKYGLDFLEFTNKAGRTEQQLKSTVDFLNSQVDTLKKEIEELRQLNRLSGTASDEKIASLALTNFQQRMKIDQLEETVELQNDELNDLRHYVESYIEGTIEFKKLLDFAEKTQNRRHLDAETSSTAYALTPRKRRRLETDRIFEDSPFSVLSQRTMQLSPTTESADEEFSPPYYDALSQFSTSDAE